MKPKILLNISNMNQLSIDVDGYILGYERFTFFSPNRFSYEDIASLDETTRLKTFILLNSLINEDNLQEALNEVDKLMKLHVNFIVQDISLMEHVSRALSSNEVIFNPYTMICSQNDLLTYIDLFQRPVVISDNLTLEEKIKLVNSVKSGIAINAFGHFPIYQSYRKVISLYEDYKNQVIKRDEQLYLREATRNELYPLIENEYGSVIFSSEPVDLSNSISSFKNAEYFLVDSFLISDDKLDEIINKIKVGVKDE